MSLPISTSTLMSLVVTSVMFRLDLRGNEVRLTGAGRAEQLFAARHGRSQQVASGIGSWRAVMPYAALTDRRYMCWISYSSRPGKGWTFRPVT